MHGLEHHQTQALADPRDRASPSKRLGMVLPSGGEDGPLPSAEQGGVMAHERQGPCDTLVHGERGAALRHAIPGGGVGALFPTLREVLVPLGRVEVWAQCCALAPERPPPELPGGPHSRGIDRGLGAPASPEQERTLRGIDASVVRFAPRDRPQGAGRPEDEGQARLSAESSEPVPGAQVGNGAHHTVALGGEALEQRLRTGFDVTVAPALTLLGEDADVQGTRMSGDPAVQWGRVGGESPKVSSCLVTFPTTNLPRG
jgi:hypothetical protein